MLISPHIFIDLSQFLNQNKFTLRFYSINPSIFDSLYFDKSIPYFFFYYSTPNRTFICFFNTSVAVKWPEVGTPIEFIESCPR